MKTPKDETADPTMKTVLGGLIGVIANWMAGFFAGSGAAFLTLAVGNSRYYWFTSPEYTTEWFLKMGVPLLLISFALQRVLVNPNFLAWAERLERYADSETSS